MACWIEVDVPKRVQVMALPKREMAMTSRDPCLAATVAWKIVDKLCGAE
jgi:hypothetical protein